MEHLEKKAAEMMLIHSLSIVHVTSDGQGFTEMQRAENHAQNLIDKTILTFEKSKEPKATNQEPEPTNLEREELIKQYAELFGKNPAHNITTEKLAAKIEEKKAAINAESKND